MLSYYQPTKNDLLLSEAISYIKENYPAQYALYENLEYTNLKKSLQGGAEFDSARQFIAQGIGGASCVYTLFFAKDKLDKWLSLPMKKRD